MFAPPVPLREGQSRFGGHPASSQGQPPHRDPWPWVPIQQSSGDVTSQASPCPAPRARRRAASGTEQASIPICPRASARAAAHVFSSLSHPAPVCSLLTQQTGTTRVPGWRQLRGTGPWDTSPASRLPARQDDGCGGRGRLTGEAGGRVDPLEQLAGAELAAVVGVAGQHQLAHLHLGGVAGGRGARHGPRHLLPLPWIPGARRRGRALRG